MKFQVVLPDTPPGSVAAMARSMAETFKMPESKAETLLRHAPGPLTKPLGEREAVRVAYKLRRLGLFVDVQPAESEPAESEPAEPPPTEPLPAVTLPAGTPPAAAPRLSPFLSQVDEAPPPVAGLDEGEPDRRVTDAPSPPAPYRPSASGTLPEGVTPLAQRHSRSQFGRRLLVAAIVPGLLALLGAWIAYTVVGEGSKDAMLAGIAASSAEIFEVALGGRDPAGSGARAEMREALSGAQGLLRAQGVELMAVASLEGSILAGWEGAGAVAPPAPDALTEGFGGLLGRAAGASGPVLGELGTADDRMRAAVSTVSVRGEPVAAVVVGAAPAPLLDAATAGLLAGIVVLSLATVVVWLTGKSLSRDHERLLDETVRISRGDLSRPVAHSDRFPDTVQALERIRVSLKEGLERLRRRKR